MARDDTCGLLSTSNVPYFCRSSKADCSFDMDLKASRFIRTVWAYINKRSQMLHTFKAHDTVLAMELAHADELSNEKRFFLPFSWHVERLETL